MNLELLKKRLQADQESRRLNHTEAMHELMSFVTDFANLLKESAENLSAKQAAAHARSQEENGVRLRKILKRQTIIFALLIGWVTTVATVQAVMMWTDRQSQAAETEKLRVNLQNFRIQTEKVTAENQALLHRAEEAEATLKKFPTFTDAEGTWIITNQNMQRKMPQQGTWHFLIIPNTKKIQQNQSK